MTTQERLNEVLDLAREYFGAANDHQLAGHLDVEPSTIGRWRNGLMLSPQAKAILTVLNLAFPGPLPVQTLAETAS